LSVAQKLLAPQGAQAEGRQLGFDESGKGGPSLSIAGSGRPAMSAKASRQG
jgi:hypothetical protein